MNTFENPTESLRTPEGEAVLARHQQWFAEQVEHVPGDIRLGKFGPEDLASIDWRDSELMIELSGAIDEWLEGELKKRN